MNNTASTHAYGHCPRCGPDRRATIQGQKITTWEAPEYDMSGGVRFSILECAGCDAVYFQETRYSSEDNEDGPTIKHWPLPAQRLRPKWVDPRGNFGLDDRLAELLREIYTALDNDLRVLAAIGMRTALELAMTLLQVPDGPFAVRLRKMVEAHHIGESQRASLEVLTEAGNAAAHRAWKPNERQLSVLMDVLEPFLHHTFVVHAQAKALGGNVPRKGQPEVKPDDFPF